jgi:hypothetical protein
MHYEIYTSGKFDRINLNSRLCGLVATDPEVGVRFPALPDFLRSSGSGTGSN